MSAIVMADEGIEIIMGTFFNNSPSAQDLKLKLFVNNYTPVRGMTMASFTEASGGGYAEKTLSNGSWTIEANIPRDAKYANQTWTFIGAIDGGATIYGYYITNNSENKVIWAQRIDTPFTPENNGDELTINPTMIQMSGGTPS